MSVTTSTLSPSNEEERRRRRVRFAENVVDVERKSRPLRRRRRRRQHRIHLEDDDDEQNQNQPRVHVRPGYINLLHSPNNEKDPQQQQQEKQQQQEDIVAVDWFLYRVAEYGGDLRLANDDFEQNKVHITHIRVVVADDSSNDPHEQQQKEKEEKKKSSCCEIPDGAFQYCSALRAIELPPTTLTRIGSGAFWECHNLQTLIVPDSVTSVGDCAFYGCTSLTTLYLPPTVTSLGQSVFSRCFNLERLYRRRSNSSSRTSPSSSPFFPKQYTSIEQWLLHRYDDHPLHKMCLLVGRNNKNNNNKEEEGDLTLDTKTVREMKQYIDTIDEAGMNPLHILALNGGGGDGGSTLSTSSTTTTAKTAAHLVDVVQALVALSQDPTALRSTPDHLGRMPLHYACLNPWVRTAALLSAVMGETIPGLVDEDHNGPSSPDSSPSSSSSATITTTTTSVLSGAATRTPFHLLCEFGPVTLSMLQTILDNSRNPSQLVSARDPWDQTPLHLVCANECVEDPAVLQLLLEELHDDSEMAHCVTNDGDQHHQTLLHCLLRRRQNIAVELIQVVLLHAPDKRRLLTAQGDSNSRSDRQQQTPLHLACANQSLVDLAVFQALVDDDDKNALRTPDGQGQYPIALALLSDRPLVVLQWLYKYQPVGMDELDRVIVGPDEAKQPEQRQQQSKQDVDVRRQRLENQLRDLARNYVTEMVALVRGTKEVDTTTTAFGAPEQHGWVHFVSCMTDEDVIEPLVQLLQSSSSCSSDWKWRLASAESHSENNKGLTTKASQVAKSPALREALSSSCNPNNNNNNNRGMEQDGDDELAVAANNKLGLLQPLLLQAPIVESTHHVDPHQDGSGENENATDVAIAARTKKMVEDPRQNRELNNMTNGQEEALRVRLEELSWQQQRRQQNFQAQVKAHCQSASLKSGCSEDVFPMFCFLVSQQEDRNHVLGATLMAFQTVHLYYVCPVTLEIPQDEYGKNMHCEFQLPQDWISQFGPALLLGLQFLPYALSIGHCASFPLPPALDGAISSCAGVEIRRMALEEWKSGLKEEVKSMVEELSERDSDAPSMEDGQVKVFSRDKVLETMQEALLYDDSCTAASAEEMETMQKQICKIARNSTKKMAEWACDPDFIRSGLEKVTAAVDGTTLYVSSAAKALFETHGSKCFSMKPEEVSAKIKALKIKCKKREEKELLDLRESERVLIQCKNDMEQEISGLRDSERILRQYKMETEDEVADLRERERDLRLYKDEKENEILQLEGRKQDNEVSDSAGRVRVAEHVYSYEQLSDCVECERACNQYGEEEIETVKAELVEDGATAHEEYKKVMVELGKAKRKNRDLFVVLVLVVVANAMVVMCSIAPQGTLVRAVRLFDGLSFDLAAWNKTDCNAVIDSQCSISIAPHGTVAGAVRLFDGLFLDLEAWNTSFYNRIVKNSKKVPAPTNTKQDRNNVFGVDTQRPRGPLVNNHETPTSTGKTQGRQNDSCWVILGTIWLCPK